MAVRLVTTDDVEAIRDVARASWEADYPGILSRETATEAVEEWYSPSQVEQAVADPLTVVSVAEREGVVVGFAHSVLDEDTGVILRLYVHPEHRNEGIGRNLFEATREELLTRDAERIRAMVLAENDPGNSFYQRLGFERVGQGETVIGEETFSENRYELRQPG